MKPEFEEAQFAVLFQDDLTHRDGDVLLAPIGQVLEARVGFDLGGHVPPTSPLWTILRSAALSGVSRPVWNPNLSPAEPITWKALNVFMQFKRSDYLHGSNAPYHRVLGEYWRFRVDRTPNVGSLPQHDLLEELESRTAPFSLVRYVAPMCHTYAKLEQLCDSRSLLEACVYVAPNRFAPSHQTCAFTSTNMVVNPDPEQVEGDSWADVTRVLENMLPRALSIDELIGITTEFAYSLGGRVQERLGFPWRILPSVDLSPETRALLEGYFVVAELLFRSRIDWMVAVTTRA